MSIYPDIENFMRCEDTVRTGAPENERKKREPRAPFVLS
jgi:hypothetical protein